MDRLTLGKLWLSRFDKVMPQESVRLRTRMAWHLAALSVRTDEELIEATDVALCQFAGGSKHFLDLRQEYLKRLEMNDVPTPATSRRGHSIRPQAML